MDDFLRRIQLIKDISIQLPVSKIDFTKKFKDNVDESDLGYEPFEMLKSSNNEYKGNILNNNFELKKRRKFFDTNYSFAKVKGELKEENNTLDVKLEINAFGKRMIAFFAFAFIFYLIFFTGAIFSASETNVPFFILPFLLVHMCFMLGIPYFVMRRSVKRMIYDLERDLHYWVTKN
ncbi:hypothetical protein [Flavobacterium luteolum]|uniref:hypothetical protein n=1 Tax=Flavobacterium luteolum TaxID=3003259 RepID=UPI00248E2C1B|nr:hypothetical protein [Flavobacterium luteolum]